MSDRRSPDPAPRRPRIGLVAVLVTLALVVGVALMIYAIRNSGGWFFRPAAAPVQAAPDYTPAQPENLSGAARAAAIDPLTLATRESALAAQLAALEARTATVATDVVAASGQAGKAEAILVAFAARRAIDRGVALGYLERPLVERFGRSQPRATAIVLQAARQSVTLAELRQGLDANTSELMSTGGDLLSSLGQELRRLVVVHEAGTPSPLPADRMARARRLLDAGQVEASLAEVRRLPGAAQAHAWIAAGQRYVDARRALDMLEAAAILGQGALPPPVVPAIPVMR